MAELVAVQGDGWLWLTPGTLREITRTREDVRKCLASLRSGEQDMKWFVRLVGRVIFWLVLAVVAAYLLLQLDPPR